MRNWDPIDIARRVVAGEVCKLGKWLTIWFERGQFIQDCRRCSVQARTSKADAARNPDELAHFLHRHTHEEVKAS